MYNSTCIALSLERQAAFPPRCVPPSREVLGGAQATENGFNMLHIKAEFHSKFNLLKTSKNGRKNSVNACQNGPKSRLKGGLGTSLGGFGGLWAAFGWFLAPRGLLGVL